MSQKKNTSLIILAVALVAAVILAIVGFVQRADLSKQVEALNSDLSSSKAACEQLKSELETTKTAAAEAATTAAAELEAAKTAAADAATAAAAELEAANTAAAEAATAAAAELEATKAAAAEAATAAAAELEAAKTAAAEAATAAAAELEAAKTAAAEAATAAAAELEAAKTAAAEAATAAAAELEAAKAAAEAEVADLKAKLAETAAPVAAPVEPAAEAKNIVVLFTSDVHCGVNEGFGYAGVAGLRDMLSADNEVILVDDGDAIQGDTIGSLTKGEAIVNIMNAVGYDVATIGNHEFDYGMDTFLALAAQAKYPYVACNFTHNDNTVFDAYKIVERGGKKIAFVGIATPRTFTSSTPVYFQDENGNFVYGFCEDATGEKLYAAVQAAADAARAEGADYVIAIGHLGTEAECTPWMSTEVIANTTGIDALLDGHAHEVCEKDVVLNKEGKEVVRAACGTKLANVGYLTIAVDGTINSGLYTAATEGVEANVTVEQNAEVANYVNQITGAFEEYLNTIVAHTDYTLTIVDAEGNRIIRNQETNLGDLVADAYRTATGADVAMVNGGGIRVTIDAGDITMNQILKAHPFGNILTMVKANGQQILDALEWASRNVPGENGGFLHVSGLTYEIHTGIESTCTSDDHGLFTGVAGERRVQNVMINGEPLDVTKEYTVASHNYMLLEGGDGTCMFMGDEEIALPETLPDYMVVINYILNTLGGNVGEQYAAPQGRIVIAE